MKRLLSTACSETAFNVSVLIIRVTFGLMLLLNHGIDKLKRFGELQNSFSDPFNIGHMPALMLVLFAEVFCVVFVVIGLFTRLMAIPIVIMFIVIVFLMHNGFVGKGPELGILYLAGFASILMMGSGKYSVDGAMGK